MTNAPLASETLAPVEPPAAVNEPVAAELPPPFPQLQAGEIPAVLVPPITQEMMADPAIDAVVSVFPKLGELGLDYYEAADLSSIVYNPQKVTEEQLKEAEANGTLAQLAAPITALEAPGAVQTPAAAPLAQEQALAAPGEPRLQTARVQNMAPRQVSPIQPRPVTNALGKRAF